MTQKPTIGRIVHFVLAGGQHRAALVVNTESDSTNTNLKVELDMHRDMSFGLHDGKPEPLPSVRGERIGGQYYGDGVLHLTSIRQDEDNHAPGTWHWPERE